MLDLAAIRAARDRIAGRVHLTPATTASRLGQRAGVQLVLKCENLQKTGSFKVRGALTKLSSLGAEERARGVVTVSAGNHAQAVAWAARAVGIQAVAHAHALERERGLVFVHPFDDEVVCSGAGTVGLELMEQIPDLDAVIVPIWPAPWQ